MLPSTVWMPLVPLLENVLSHRSAAAAELLSRLRQRSSSSNGPLGQFSSAPPGGGPPSAFGQQSGGHQQQQQQYQQQSGFGGGSYQQQQGGFGNQGPYAQGASPHQMAQAAAYSSAPPNQAQTIQRLGGDAAAGPCPQDFVEIQYEAPRVGIQNTNNTCYMNSFMQSLYMTNHFVWRIFNFQLKLKKKPSKMDKEDYQFGKKVVELMQRHMTKMSMTKYKHTDIAEILDAFPPDYRSGEQQDVTECIRFIFDKLGSFEQPLIREVFAGELSEKLRCQVCATIKTRPETFTDLVLPVPTADEVEKTGVVPTVQNLLDQRLQFELMDEDEPVNCDTCNQKQRFGKWCEIVSPPAHLCVCLNRFSFDLKAMAMIKEKTPVKVDGVVQIGPFTYVLYFVIVHTGKDATSGHYYALGHRSEEGPGQGDWTTLDDSQLKPCDLSILQGAVDDKKKDDNPYVLFYRCQQAPATPQTRIPKKIANAIRKEDDARQES